MITLTPCYTTLIRYFTFSNENVWWLCDSVKKKFPEEIQYCYCVYISNEQRAVRICKKQCFDFKKIIFPSYKFNLHCLILVFKRPRFGNRKQVINKMDKLYGSVYNITTYFFNMIKIILSYSRFILFLTPESAQGMKIIS